MISYPITPVPKPRQTRSDKWKSRPCVQRYRAFADEVRLRMGGLDLDGKSVTFCMPMPKSWSNKRKDLMVGLPHRQKPDLDNLMKALGDALHQDDSHIASIRMRKIWSGKGEIWIDEVKT